MDEKVAANRTHWNELATIHQRPSAYYDIDAFRGGALSLRPLERTEVGDVRGKSLLHLQCHFGLDTLSWARLGPRCTGVDVPDVSIEHAPRLAEELAIDNARFICADIDSTESFDETFDIVFTSFGTTVWLPDLDRWAKLIARSLAPDGVFYIVDSHPAARRPSATDVGIDAYVFDAAMQVIRPYFRRDAEHCEPGYGDYAVADAHITTASYEWTHTLGDIVTALAGAGLRIEYLHEHPFADWQFIKSMQRSDDGYFRFTDGAALPLMYSIKATR
jgi:SAM-dependent methyltransferase